MAQPALDKSGLESLLKLFELDKKSEVERHCRTLAISGEDFFNLVCGCDFAGIPFQHQIFSRDSVPEHLNPSDEQVKALTENGVGELKIPGAIKAVRKMSQMFVERRLLVGRMFYVPDLTRWHFFCFDQRDLEERGPNHWKEGSHVHFTNWLWPGQDAKSVWANFVNSSERPADSLHVRFQFSR